MSILYFVKPTKLFRNTDWLHFIPFVIYAVAENIWNHGKDSISTFPLFDINQSKPFLIRDILPIVTLLYILRLFNVLAKHKTNLKRITSNIDHNNLDWLVQFLAIFSLSVVFWVNDALFGLPFVSHATNFVHAGAIFFAAYFSIKQKAIFSFKEKDIKAISEVLEYEHNRAEAGVVPGVSEPANDTGIDTGITENAEAVKQRPNLKRLNAEQVTNLSEKLSFLMEKDKIFLDNDLNLPTVAEKLGITIHETSFLINEATKDNFYNFINGYRVEEAKRLLASAKMEELNILGIAFASGFNSKTTFNTTFKRIVGISPSQYSKTQKK